MAACVRIENGLVVGTTEPVETCTGFILLDSANYSELAASPFRLSIEEAQQIGQSILLVWAVAFGFRALRRLIETQGETNDGS